MHKVLVTGANGFIGSALCRRMIAEGWGVRGAVRSSAKKHLLPPGIDAVAIGSIDAHTEWETAVCDIDTIVHLAGRVHVMADISSDPITAFRNINVAGTKRLAQIAKSKKVRRFVYVSSIKVNGEGKSVPYTVEDFPLPTDPYAISKFEAEKELHRIAGNTGLEVVILRPPLVYGPKVKANFLKLIKLVDRGIPLPLAKLNNHRSMIYLNNLIDAVLICIDHPKAAGKTYLLSDGKDISTTELVQMISSALGRPSRLFPLHPGLLRFVAKLTGRTNAVSRLLDSLVVDSSKIRTELDWSPPYSMEEGIRVTAKWYLKAFG